MTFFASNQPSRSLTCLLALALAATASGCLLQEHGQCDAGANPKEHACRAATVGDPITFDAGGPALSACVPVLESGAHERLRAGVSLLRGSCGGEGPENARIFTAPRAGRYSFYTTDSTFDPLVYVLRGRCGGPEIGCDDDGGEGAESQVSADLAQHERVTVIVDGYLTGDGGTYRLHVEGP